METVLPHWNLMWPWFQERGLDLWYGDRTGSHKDPGAYRSHWGFRVGYFRAHVYAATLKPSARWILHLAFTFASLCKAFAEASLLWFPLTESLLAGQQASSLTLPSPARPLHLRSQCHPVPKGDRWPSQKLNHYCLGPWESSSNLWFLLSSILMFIYGFKLIFLPSPPKRQMGKNQHSNLMNTVISEIFTQRMKETGWVSSMSLGCGSTSE